jgi:hypothetical protein
VEALDLRDRVRLRLEEDHVGVWPDRERGDTTGGDAGRPPEASR